MNHFDEIVKRLSRDDLLVLNTLLENDAIQKFQSMDKVQIINESKVTDYTFRKTIERLEMLLFIEITKTNRFHHYYLTDYGILAIQKITEGVEV